MSEQKKEWLLVKRWYDSVDILYEVRTDGLKIRISKQSLSKKTYEVICIIDTDGVLI